jgi:hypothetical protein
MTWGLAGAKLVTLADTHGKCSYLRIALNAQGPTVGGLQAAAFPQSVAKSHRSASDRLAIIRRFARL